MEYSMGYSVEYSMSYSIDVYRNSMEDSIAYPTEHYSEEHEIWILCIYKMCYSLLCNKFGWWENIKDKNHFKNKIYIRNTVVNLSQYNYKLINTYKQSHMDWLYKILKNIT